MLKLTLQLITALALALAGALLIYRVPLSAAAAISVDDMAYVEKTRYTTLYDRSMLSLCHDRFKERGGTVGRCLALSADSIQSPIGRFLLVAAIYGPNTADITPAEKRQIVTTSENVLQASIANPVWPKYQRLLDACATSPLPCPVLGRPKETSILRSLDRMRQIVSGLQDTGGDADIKSEIERIANEAAQLKQ